MLEKTIFFSLQGYQLPGSKSSSLNLDHGNKHLYLNYTLDGNTKRNKEINVKDSVNSTEEEILASVIEEKQRSTSKSGFIP